AWGGRLLRRKATAHRRPWSVVRGPLTVKTEAGYPSGLPHPAFGLRQERLAVGVELGDDLAAEGGGGGAGGLRLGEGGHLLGRLVERLDGLGEGEPPRGGAGLRLLRERRADLLARVLHLLAEGAAAVEEAAALRVEGVLQRRLRGGEVVGDGSDLLALGEVESRLLRRAHARDGALEGLGQGHEDGLKGSPGGAASVGEGAGGPHRDRMTAHADAERPEGDPARVPLTATGAIQSGEAWVPGPIYDSAPPARGLRRRFTAAGCRRAGRGAGRSARPARRARGCASAAASSPASAS